MKASKLDPYRLTILEMKDAGKSFDDIQAWLKEEGCTVGRSTVADYWQQAYSRREQDRLLDSITSGAAQCQEVEEKFGKNPAPELETLIKLHRVLILQLSTNANSNPELLKLANDSLRTVMEFFSGQTKARFKERELNLAEAKYAQLALKLAGELKVIASNKSLSEAEKVDQARLKLFGVEGE